MADNMPDRIWAAQFLGEREWNTTPPDDEKLGAVEYVRVKPVAQMPEPEGGLKTLSVKEFRELGYLQELNRRFLHPLGLAIEVVLQENGQEYFGRVWDARDDPEGWAFGEGLIDPAKAEFIYEEMATRGRERMKALGWFEQPIPKQEE